MRFSNAATEGKNQCVRVSLLYFRKMKQLHRSKTEPSIKNLNKKTEDRVEWRQKIAVVTPWGTNKIKKKIQRPTRIIFWSICLKRFQWSYNYNYAVFIQNSFKKNCRFLGQKFRNLPLSSGRDRRREATQPCFPSLWLRAPYSRYCWLTAPQISHLFTGATTLDNFLYICP